MLILRWLESRRGACGCSTIAGIGGRGMGRVGDVESGSGGASGASLKEVVGRFINRPADRGSDGGASSGGASYCVDGGRLTCGLSSAGGGAMLANGHMAAGALIARLAKLFC